LSITIHSALLTGHIGLHEQVKDWNDDYSHSSLTERDYSNYKAFWPLEAVERALPDGFITEKTYFLLWQNLKIFCQQSSRNTCL
jgi:hypothetical protein